MSMRTLTIAGLTAAALTVAGGCSSTRAATLTASCTAPAFDNDGASCGVGAVLVAPQADSVFMFFEVAALGVRDSSYAARGSRVSRAWPAPAGSYAVRAWAAVLRPDGSLLAGCDTTATLPATAAPARPSGLAR